MKPIKIRCSALGQVMTGTIGLTEAQGKKIQEYYARTKPLTEKMVADLAELEHKRDNPTLPKTVINYLAELEVQLRTGRRKKIMTPQMEKGLAVEEDSITLLSTVRGQFYQKNEKHFENEYVTGTPDILTESMVRDIKSSWDIFTFPHRWTYGMNSDYYWQLQGYMWLTDKERASLDYCLVTAPNVVIEREIKRLMFSSAVDVEGSDMFKDFEQLARENLVYDDIPEEHRVYSIPVERDDNAIEQIKTRIELCREWWNENIRGREVEEL